jgi:hypothetical protein
MNKHIIILIDNSYSMDIYRDKIILGLNNFITKLKNNSINNTTYISVIVFTEEPIYIYTAINLKDIRTFEKSHFTERGCTAIYDVVYSVLLQWSNKELDNNTLYIISDGSDNNSRVYGITDVEKMIKYMTEDRKWKIIHCDTDIDKLNTIKHTNPIIYDINNIDDLFNQMSLY